MSTSSNQLSWNDSVGFGDRGRLARTGWRPADQIAPASNAPFGSPMPRDEAIGGTPMAATGTVAIPIPIESFRLSRE
jgi:hypothetical protein